ncbi:MAG TPA: LLM class flavin-dependent oxidoreductase [Solirubrobacteraceae bacterium]|jgi:alkanesulfonate monooxygenase SsuD/methylene tetrahydromethanopterin reductase-like flavin-dependent oxidoreductase (luciferase family)
MVGEIPRIGLYCDLRNPGGAKSWSEVYAGTLERIVEAERRGLDAVWVTEHHGFADGYLPQPLVFCSAVAARTRNLRIGTGIVIAPLMHPLALAEQAAIVDLVSAGRLELGLGAGYREDEFAAFGAEHSRRYETLESMAKALPELWASGKATPAPAQSPLPLWVGGRGPRGARIAGRVGAGFLWIDGELLEPYLKGLSQGGHDPSSARMGGLVNLFLADDPEAVTARIREHGRHNRETYKRGGEAGGSAPLLRLNVFSPQDAARNIAEVIDGLPVTDIFCFERIGAMDDELVERHIELLTDELPRHLKAELQTAGANTA